jgi:hypothetical protein
MPPRSQILKLHQLSPVTSYGKQSNSEKELGITSIIRIYTTVCTQIPLLQSSGWDEFASELSVFATK